MTCDCFITFYHLTKLPTMTVSVDRWVCKFDKTKTKRTCDHGSATKIVRTLEQDMFLNIKVMFISNKDMRSGWLLDRVWL